MLILLLSGLTCFAQFGVEQPFFKRELSDCLFPQDSMETYVAASLLDGLNGGCLWDGAYESGTFSNMVNMLWYVDANDEYSLHEATNGANPLLEGGTNYVWTITRELVTVETNQWTDVPVLGVYTNLFTFLFYVDASAEYDTNAIGTETNTLAGLALGTNWHLALTRYASTTTTNEQAWTNAFAAKVYTNSPKTLWYVDAMDEYADSAGLTNLVGGTNFIWVFTATNDLVTTQGWTNAYAAKDY